MKKAITYARHRDISDYIYTNIGKYSRNLLGKTELNNKEVTRQDILNIYNRLKSQFTGIVLSRVEDILSPSYQDHRYGAYKPFAEQGFLKGEKYTLLHEHRNMFGVYKVHRDPHNNFCTMVVKGPMVCTNYFEHKREAIVAYNNILELNGCRVTILEKDFYH
jgi:hypothetical protein